MELSKYEKVVKFVGPILAVLAALNYYQGYKSQEDEELYDQILYEEQSITKIKITLRKRRI